MTADPERSNPRASFNNPFSANARGESRPHSQKPLKSMMQHLTVDGDSDYGGGGGGGGGGSRSAPTSPSRRESLMRRISRRASRSPSATGSPSRSRTEGSEPAPDPRLCTTCQSLAADVLTVFDEADEFVTVGKHGDGVDVTADTELLDEGEHFIAKLNGLEENRWSMQCPLCKLFFASRVAGSPGSDAYLLSGFSSRNMNYLIDSKKLFNTNHPTVGRDRAYCPAYLGVVPQKKVLTSVSWEVEEEKFRSAHMIFRTSPTFPVRKGSTAGRSPAKGRQRSITPEPPQMDKEYYMSRGIWGREIGPSVDMSVVRGWLRYCENQHPDRCARRPLTGRLAGFRLIDCHQSRPQLVEMPLGESYVALSYVHGPSTAEERWPQVFQDAVKVTRDLGVRYLWIDTVCIDHTQREHRQSHMARMDEIYEGAVVTIMAATTGDDPKEGLPGVDYTGRAEQPKYTFTNSNMTVVSSLRDPKVVIKESPWYSNAWTYQAGVLARRRLIFTKEQVYWECEGMSCQETLQLPLDLYHDRDEQRMCDFVYPGLFNGISHGDGSSSAWRRREAETSTLGMLRQVDQHIVEHSQRQLGPQEDVLDGFWGIERRMQRGVGNGRLGSVMGVPIWAPPSSEKSNIVDVPRTRDMFALFTSFWQHKRGVAVHRRPGLPSWSWAGWSGAVELFSAITVVDPQHVDKESKIHNYHYARAALLTRNEPTSLAWVYSPEMRLLRSDGTVAWDFAPSRTGPPHFAQDHYVLHVRNPLVLDRVKARVLPQGGWMFNDVSVDVRLSHVTERGAAAAAGPTERTANIRSYIERHAKGEQMTLLWFVEETTIMLLVVERKGAVWERVGRMRMGLWGEKAAVLGACGNLDGLVGKLPLRRLGEDVVIA